MPTPPPSPPHLRTVASESFLLVSSHARHFLALSLLFLLPPSFISFSIPSSPTPFHTQSLLRAHSLPLRQSPPVSTTAFAVFSASLLFSVLATCSITYSVLHAFYGRPVKLIPSLRSITSSFLRMLSTLSISLSTFLLPAAPLILSDPLVRHPASSPLFAALSVAASIVALVVVTYLQILWSLAVVVVVAELEWGLRALRRSGYLIRGTKMLAFKLHLLFLALFGVLVWLGSRSAGTEDRWLAVAVVVTASSGVMAVAVMSLAAGVVLYMYCRAAKGELAAEVAEEFATEYVSLPFDEGKVPHLISAYHPE